MSEKSAIEWTDATWNPTTGCTKVSPACANCYIERTPPFRVRGRRFVNGHIPVELHPDRLDTPMRRRKPTVYFVNSLSDLFHEDIPDAFIDRVFAVMALAPQHTFQILTKRAERMRDYVASRSTLSIGVRHARSEICQSAYFVTEDNNAGSKVAATPWPFPNVWLGVSVENQHFADERIPLLLQTPAAVRFLSVEPMLGPVNLQAPCAKSCPQCRGAMEVIDSESGGFIIGCPCERLAGLHWVIVGAESGPRLRPTDPAWVRSIRDQCNAAGVAFFFKQWGGKTAKAGGRELDGRTWDEMPAMGTPIGGLRGDPHA